MRLTKKEREYIEEIYECIPEELPYWEVEEAITDYRALHTRLHIDIQDYLGY